MTGEECLYRGVAGQKLRVEVGLRFLQSWISEFCIFNMWEMMDTYKLLRIKWKADVKYKLNLNSVV